MKTSHIALLLILLSSSSFNFAQQDEIVKQDRYLRIMFYNVENLFDAENDSVTNDQEFLPEGNMHWTKGRYWEKLQHISSVIVAAGGWAPPEIIGLCEIENRQVLEDLCFRSSLSQLKYRFIHKESPDPRGIDVALLYQPNSFKPTGYKAIKVSHPDKPWLLTRDILHVEGTTKSNDTIHIFVNHWPSRSGGQLESEPNRILAATILRNSADSLLVKNPFSKIIIMGDFNDYPENHSVAQTLNAHQTISDIRNDQLYNLTAIKFQDINTGTHKFQGEWGILDQIIVSGSLLNAAYGLYVPKENIHIFNAEFLLEDDEAFSGKKPFRTYLGFKYQGGFSDHLPVFIDIDYLK
jgi:predicted extracellular nuclease